MRGGIEPAADQWFGDVAASTGRNFVPARGERSRERLGSFPGGRCVAISASVALGCTGTFHGRTAFVTDRDRFRGRPESSDREFFEFECIIRDFATSGDLVAWCEVSDVVPEAFRRFERDTLERVIVISD